MEGGTSHILSYLNQFIQGSKVIQLILRNKVIAVTSASAIAYGLWFLKRPRNLPPGPYGYPLIGSSPIFSSNDFTGELVKLGEKYGDIFCLWLGGNRYLVVLNSYSAIKEAYLTRGSDFMDRQPFSESKGFGIKDTIFNAHYDNEYRASRKIVSQALRNFISQKLDTIVYEEIDQVSALLEKNGKTGVDIHELASKTFANVVLNAVFGKRLRHDDEKLTDLSQLVKEWFHAFMMTATLQSSPIRAFFHKDKIRLTQTLTEKLLQTVKDFFDDCQVGITPGLENEEPTCVAHAYVKDAKFSIDQIMGTLLVFLPDALHTAVAMCQWVFLYLLHYPEYQDKIVREIREICSRKKSAVMSVKDRNDMPITESFIMEVFRVVSPAPVGIRNNPTHDTTLRSYDIPSYVEVLAHYEIAHKDPMLFENPDAFKPERFVENGKISKTDGFFPFGLGRRMCVGEGMVRNEIFLFVTNFLRRYEVCLSVDGLPTLEKDRMELVTKPYQFNIDVKDRM